MALLLNGKLPFDLCGSADRKTLVQTVSRTRAPLRCSPPCLAEDLGEVSLLASSNEADEVPRAEQTPAVTIPKLLSSPELRRPLLIIIFATVSQQISGMIMHRLFVSIRVLRIHPRHQRR